MKVTVLGCGASGGVPLIGCKCAVCLSGNPKNKRTRASVFIEAQGARLLVDTGPDLREQCLRHGISTVDAIVYTHAHADHLHGIDDVRSFNYTSDAPVKACSDALTLKYIQEKFPYCFLPPKPAAPGWFRPCLAPVEITAGKAFAVGAVEIFPFEQVHGNGTSLGLRIGDFAYSTDTNGLPAAALDALRGVDTWVVDCLRHEPAPTHAHLEMALGWIAQVKPRRAYLTHLNHGFEYEGFAARLPGGVFPAYDGLVLEL